MSLEFNKIAASVLTAGVVAMGSGFIADLLVHPKAPDEPAYQVAVKEDTGKDKASEPKGPKAVLPMLASADVSAGENASRACQACHSFNKGGPNKVGPNLYGVVGDKIASVEGFSYSDALKSKEGKWTYQKLNKFLHNPSGWAPGTNMSYAGVKDAQKRANLIAYLREQDDSPMALPSEEEVAAAKQASAGADGAAGGDDASGDGEQMAKADDGGGDADGGKAAETGGDSAGGGGDAHAMIADASAAKGEAAIAVCKACHSFNKGGPNKVGPNLYNVVGSDIASAEGFSYSKALKGKDGKWTYDKLWAYLENPQKWAPGTNMSYPGVKDPGKRANIIAYLRQQSDDPPALKADAADAGDGDGTQKAEAETGGGSAGEASAQGDGESAGSGEDTGGTSETGGSASDAGAADREASASEAASDSPDGESPGMETAGDGEAETSAGNTQAEDTSSDAEASAETDAKADEGGNAGATQTAEADGGGSPVHAKIADASAAKGEAAIAVCKACHSFTKGGPNKVGPNLYGVVGSDIASADGFTYSKALKGKDGAWTYSKLWNYLENPQKWAPGTNMSYPGVKDPAKRANIIAYLRQQADDPPELNP